MEYQCTRTRRKSIEIRVTSDGKVLVRAPKNCPKKTIDRIVDERRSWIEGRKNLVKIQAKQAIRFWDDGPRELTLFGARYPVEQGTPARLEEERIILPPLSREGKRKAAIALYRAALQKTADEMINQFAPVVGARPKKVGISSARRQWGSCSSNGNIYFSWRLALAPKEAVEYVVVHELCHLLYPNHSKHFWREVEKILPDYRQRREKLKITEALLKEQGLGENE